MNTPQISFKCIVLALCLISMGAHGQKQTKTYNENFMVTDATVLDINTSHADIEFETWDKPQIQIEATIELEGVSEKEAESYFEHDGIEIIGNSTKVAISTGAENTWFFRHGGGEFGGSDFNFNFEIPEVPSMHMDLPLWEIDVLPELAEMPQMPPMPPIPPMEFDYEAYKKDGEKYLKKWQKQFSKGFNKDYEARLEEWSAKMDAKRAEMEEKMELLGEKRMEERENLLDQREEQHERLMERRTSDREKARDEHRKDEMTQSHPASIFYMDSLRQGPNFFYLSKNSENKNYKVKKTIKIRMPKATKIQMNVRHGEVKLAEITKNLNATLSYATLLAATIDGDATNISASYSPVMVQRWNYGQLKANYSESVDIKEVLNLRLSATSSDVVIDHLTKSAYIVNDLGPLKIKSISKDFKVLDITMKNAELACKLPSSSFIVYVNGTNSEFSGPTSLTLEKSKNLNSFVNKGYHVNKNSDRSITINAKYSEVVLE